MQSDRNVPCWFSSTTPHHHNSQPVTREKKFQAKQHEREQYIHKYGQSFLLVVSSHRRDEKFCLSRRTSVHDWFVDKSPKQFLLLICTAPFFFVKWKIIVIKAHFPFYLFMILRNFPSFKWLDTRRVCVDHHQTTTPGHWQKT